jgi:hypothetical protein
MAVAKTGDDRTAPGGPERSEGGRTEDFLDGARNAGSAGRGRKSSVLRCGIKNEAKPISGQTCPIENADGALPAHKKGENMAGRQVRIVSSRRAIGSLSPPFNDGAYNRPSTSPAYRRVDRSSHVESNMRHARPCRHDRSGDRESIGREPAGSLSRQQATP